MKNNFIKLCDELSYKDYFKYYCFLNCYYNILKYYGINQPLHYLDCHIDFKYEEGDFQTIFTCADKFSSLNPLLSKALHYYSDDTIDENERVKLENDLISKGIPIIMTVDIYYLPYTPFYKKKHGFHSLIYCGLIDESDEVFIYDWYDPWYYKGLLSRSVLEDARKSLNEDDGILGNVPIKHLSYYIDNDIQPKNPKIYLHQTFSLLIDKFFSDNPNQGYNALIKLFETIQKLNTEEYEAQKLKLETLYNSLYFVKYREYLLLNYFNAFFLEDSEIRFIYLLKELADKWNVLCNQILKVIYKKHTNEDIENIKNKFFEICLNEKEFYYEIFCFYSRLIFFDCVEK